ncbi:(2Fe-2S)-binding protein [Tropicimonas sp. IMCC34011]|uniref:(2Fe-2S)-binding protein n=1 Tax=Tropicimonas sp. IMCC34011 TaxID=2248759 RepID=UPI000E253726
MFEPVTPPDSADADLTFTFDGAEIQASTGMTVAAALLARGYRRFRRSSAASENTGPYCMMGACYGCIVDIDGTSVQSCMTPVVAGLVVRSLLPSGDDT